MDGDVLRADKTVPAELEIRPSMLLQCGKGVWTKTALPKGTRFGPYGGVITKTPSDNTFCWEVCN